MLVVILLLLFISFLIFILLLFFISFSGYFTMSPALHPSFSDTWRLPPVLSSTPTTFDFLFFFIYRECYGFQWAFLTHRHFLPYAPFQHFWHNLLLSRPPWEPAVLLWRFAGLHTDPRNTDLGHLFVWFTVIHNPLHILNLYLYMSILQNFLLVVKTLIKKHYFSGSVLDRIKLSSRLATTLISQQSWKHKAAATLISNHKLQNNCSPKKYISEHKCKN